MAGQFTGISDSVWAIIETYLPTTTVPKTRGRPHASCRKVINTILGILITGARWVDVPRGEDFASRSTAHRWLGIWESDGTWANLQAHLLGEAQELGLIDWERASIDSSFAAGKGGGEGVQYGFKGKGVNLHTVVDGNGLPLAVISTGAAESERAQVAPLLDSIPILTGKPGRPKPLPAALPADKGYDSRELRARLRTRGVKPLIPRRSWPNRKPFRGRPPAQPIDRWKVERTFAWCQRKYRRLVVRWERREKYWNGFISLAICMFWIDRLNGILG